MILENLHFNVAYKTVKYPVYKGPFLPLKKKTMVRESFKSRSKTIDKTGEIKTFGAMDA